MSQPKYDIPKIRRLVRARGWELYDLATFAKVSQTTIYRCTGGHGNWSAKTARAIAAALEVKVADLVIEVDPTPAPETTEE